LVVAKSYRPVLRDQPMLLPVDLRQWLPADHLVWFVLDVVDAMDTSGLERTRRRGGAGTAGYDPRMLFALLVYAYCQGVRSSRQIERLCITDVAFRVLCAQDTPDHTTIARFRDVAAEGFTDLFAQVLLVAATAGLARFDAVAIDGTKIAANASIDANRGRAWFERHAAELIAHAEATDRVEDAAAAQEGQGCPDRVPAGLADRTSRGERIRAAAAELAAQEQLRGRAEQERQEAALARRRRSEQGGPWSGGSRTGPIGWRRPERTWPGRSPSTRPSSTGTPRSPPGAASRWVARRCRWTTAPGCSRPVEWWPLLKARPP